MPDAHATNSPPQGNWFAALPVLLPHKCLTGLRDGAPPGLKWFVPEDVHLTLAFFGRCPESRLSAVVEVLKTMPPPDIEAACGKLRVFPSPRRFSAISFELAKGAAEVADYMQRWQTPLLTAAGLPPNTRLPLPHVTIARPFRGASAAERSAILRWCGVVKLADGGISLQKPALYGWAEDRSIRQFRRIEV